MGDPTADRRYASGRPADSTLDSRPVGCAGRSSSDARSRWPAISQQASGDDGLPLKPAPDVFLTIAVCSACRRGRAGDRGALRRGLGGGVRAAGGYTHPVCRGAAAKGHRPGGVMPGCRVRGAHRCGGCTGRRGRGGEPRWGLAGARQTCSCGFEFGAAVGNAMISKHGLASCGTGCQATIVGHTIRQPPDGGRRMHLQVRLQMSGARRGIDRLSERDDLASGLAVQPARAVGMCSTPVAAQPCSTQRHTGASARIA